jgi:hypothetical protein
MVFYHNSERTPGSLGLMRSEIRDVAGMIAAMVRPDEDPDQVNYPVEVELMARYGHEAGPGLFADFLEAFGTVAPAASRLAPGAMSRRGRRSNGIATGPFPPRPSRP